ncbi:MAG: phosphate transport system regulatory protein PhoU [Chloroflexi bacterium RBG_16_47_49]|nr:MAG: phosphate transport system regulatory protein PhoU [Chloroflexi bacterium RBG_16_47_49]
MFHGIRSTLDREFDEVRSELMGMSVLVDTAIDHSMVALMQRNTKLADEVIKGDTDINKYRFNLEEACLTLIATQQPTASDLREIIAILYMIVEMERMGDYAAGIAKTVILMEEEPLLKTFKKIFKMADISRHMLADSIQAYMKRDPVWARDIASRDNEIDEVYKIVFQRLIKIMAKEHDMVTRCTYLMWCSHNLERIADRVVNITEQIIFMTTGMLKEFE